MSVAAELGVHLGIVQQDLHVNRLQLPQDLDEQHPRGEHRDHDRRQSSRGDPQRYMPLVSSTVQQLTPSPTAKGNTLSW